MCACRRALRARTSTSPLLSQSTGRSSSRASSRTITTRCLPLPPPPGRWRAGTCLRCAAPISTSASPQSRAATLAKASRATTWWRWLASSSSPPGHYLVCTSPPVATAGPVRVRVGFCRRRARRHFSARARPLLLLPRRRWWRGRRAAQRRRPPRGAQSCALTCSRRRRRASRPSVRSRRRWQPGPFTAASVRTPSSPLSCSQRCPPAPTLWQRRAARAARGAGGRLCRRPHRLCGQRAAVRADKADGCGVRCAVVHVARAPLAAPSSAATTVVLRGVLPPCVMPALRFGVLLRRRRRPRRAHGCGGSVDAAGGELRHHRAAAL